MIDRKHPLVGKSVVYRDPHTKTAEQGVVKAVSVAARAAFVSYGNTATSQQTPVSRLTTLSGEPVLLDV